MKEDKKFSIKVMGKEFYSDEDGMFNLNTISKAFNLKPPSQWRTKERRALEADAKLHSLKNTNQGKGEASHFMMADEDATIFYGMHISYEFGLAVVQAFRELRRGNFEEAIKIAGSTMSEEDEHLLIKFASMKGLCFTKSCWYANIKHPTKFLIYLKRNSKWKYFSENSFGRLYATEEGIEKGIVYNCYGDPETSKVVMRFTQKGRDLLRKHSKHFNSRVEEKLGEL